MTPEERKRWERRAWDFCDNEHGFESPCVRCQHLAEAFFGAITAAVAEEREAIAKQVEDYSWAFDGYKGMAAAIRARSG